MVRHVGGHAAGLVAAAEAAAVDEDDRRAARLRVARRPVEVEPQRLPDAARVHGALPYCRSRVTVTPLNVRSR